MPQDSEAIESGPMADVLAKIHQDLAEIRAALQVARAGPAPGRAASPRGAGPTEGAPRRRFQISDGLILVVAVALDLGLIRAVLGALMGPAAGSRDLPRWATLLIVVVATWMVATPSWLVLRLGRPRPPLRRLATRPGFVAAATASSTLALSLATFGLVAAVRPLVRTEPIAPYWWFGSLTFAAAIIGPAVGGAWALLALSGRRRPQRGAFDNTGRILGAGWVALFVVAVVVRIIFGSQL